MPARGWGKGSSCTSNIFLSVILIMKKDQKKIKWSRVPRSGIVFSSKHSYCFFILYSYPIFVSFDQDDRSYMMLIFKSVKSRFYPDQQFKKYAQKHHYRDVGMKKKKHECFHQLPATTSLRVLMDKKIAGSGPVEAVHLWLPAQSVILSNMSGYQLTDNRFPNQSAYFCLKPDSKTKFEHLH